MHDLLVQAVLDCDLHPTDVQLVGARSPRAASGSQPRYRAASTTFLNDVVHLAGHREVDAGAVEVEGIAGRDDVKSCVEWGLGFLDWRDVLLHPPLQLNRRVST